MTIRTRLALGALACSVALVAGTALATPVTLQLKYVADSGDPAIKISGSVTYDDAVQTPNQNIVLDTTGLIAVTITVQGPGVPGGSTTFTEADGMTWAFATDGARNITDLNFFSDPNGTGCFVRGYEVFLLGFYCGDPETPEDFVTLKRLVLNLLPPPIPTLDPIALALLSILLAAAAAAAVPALRRRR